MREFNIFLVFLITVSSLLGICCGVAYVADPGGLFFDEAFYSQMADTLISGKSVTDLPPNFDDGKFRSIFISKDPSPRSVIILGSSRVMVINKTVLTPLFGQNFTFLNNFLLGSTLNSEIGKFELYAQKGDLPEYIILGLEPWTLEKYTIQSNQIPEDIVLSGKSRIGYNVTQMTNPLGWTRYESILSRPYIFQSMQTLYNRNFKLVTYQPKTTDQFYDATNFTWHPDGSRSFPLTYIQMPEKNLEKAVQKFVSDSLPPYYEDFYFDPEKVSLFTRFVEYLQQQNIRVYFYLSPQHPLVYEKSLNEQRKGTIIDEEKYYRSFAHDHNIPLIGSFDPRPWNLSSKDYYDWSHPRYEVISRIFESYGIDSMADTGVSG